MPDPSGELRKLIGASAEDLWAVGMMVDVSMSARAVAGALARRL